MEFKHLVAALLVASPLVGSAASFECSKASTRIEHLVCGSAIASGLDEWLDAVYSKILTFQPESAAELKRSQRKWLKEERNVCTDEPCVIARYRERLKALGVQGDLSVLPVEFAQPGLPLKPVAAASNSPQGDPAAPKAAAAATSTQLAQTKPAPGAVAATLEPVRTTPAKLVVLSKGKADANMLCTNAGILMAERAEFWQSPNAGYHFAREQQLTPSKLKRLAESFDQAELLMKVWSIMMSKVDQDPQKFVRLYNQYGRGAFVTDARAACMSEAAANGFY
jgi:uncharacterized protein